MTGYFFCFLIGFPTVIFFYLLLLPPALFLRLVAVRLTKVMPRKAVGNSLPYIFPQKFNRTDTQRICFVLFLIFGFVPLAGKIVSDKVLASSVEVITTQASPDGRYVASFMYADLGGIGGSSYVKIKPTSFWYQWSEGDTVVYDTGGRILKGISWSGSHTLQIIAEAPEVQLVSHDHLWKDVNFVYQQHSL